MPRYKVNLTERIVEYYTVEVEADDELEAVEKADEMRIDGSIRPIDWLDNESDAEAILIQETGQADT